MKRSMTKLMALGALTAGVMMAGTRAEAASLPGQNGLRPALDSLALIETVQASFWHRGRRYCWYDNGYFGAGWYVCGYARHPNRLYWGGGRGWNQWWHGGWGRRPAGWGGGGTTIIINPMGGMKGPAPMMGGKGGGGGGGGGGPGPMGKGMMGGP